MLESPRLVVQPTHGDGTGGNTELQLLRRHTHPAMVRDDFLPILHLLTPSASPTTRVVLGDDLITSPQDPIQVGIRSETTVEAQADVWSLMGSELQHPLASPHGVLQRGLA